MKKHWKTPSVLLLSHSTVSEGLYIILECGWNVAGTFHIHIYFGMWQEHSKTIYILECGMNVAGTFHHHVYFLMWQERARVTFHSIRSAGTLQECFLWMWRERSNITSFMNVVGMCQSNIPKSLLWGRDRNVFLMWKERSQTTLNFNVTGTWQRNVPKSLVWKHDRNVLLECGKNVLRPHSIWTWQERDRNVKKSRTFWNVTGTFFWYVAGMFQNPVQYECGGNVTGTFQKPRSFWTWQESGRNVTKSRYC